MNNIIKIFRLHHWVKNLIIFVPFFAAHKIISVNALQVLFVGFLSFSLCASAIYIVNDLFDVKSDAKHTYKKFRPFASGKISMQNCILLSIFLIFISFFLAKRFLSFDFLLVILTYFFLALSYSVYLKKFIFIDTLVLSVFYTLRIFAGSAIIEIDPSFWLITFSIFFFLSLAFVKRYTEIVQQQRNKILNRGYLKSDKIFIGITGVSTGLIATLISALYINSEKIIVLYKNPKLMWISVIIILFWIMWIWLNTFRKKMDYDPILFACKDLTSILLGICLLITYLLATYI